MDRSAYKPTQLKLTVVHEPFPLRRRTILSEADSAEIFYDWWDKDTICLKETAALLLLNRASKVLGIVELSTGGQSAAIIDAKQVFSAALLGNAAAIILAHNHPSGQAFPSQADIILTTKLSQGAKYLDLQLTDHIIITPTPGEYYSMLREGHII